MEAAMTEGAQGVVDSTGIELTADQKTSMLASSVAEQCSMIMNTLEKCEFETRLEIYKQLDEIVQISYRWKCAILWSIRESAPHGKSHQILTESAKELGITYRTALRKAQIWDMFYQESKTGVLSPPKRHYVFDELPNTESWFRIALESEDPEKAILEAESKFEENRSSGGTYTPKMMKKDLGMLTDREVLEEAAEEALKEKAAGTLVEHTVVYWETNLENGKTPIIEFLRDYFRTDKYVDGVRPKALFNSKTGEEIPF
jgi:hypothetical protein